MSANGARGHLQRPVYFWIVLRGVPRDIRVRSRRHIRPEVPIEWGSQVLGPRLATLLVAPQPRTTGSLFWKLRRVRWHRADDAVAELLAAKRAEVSGGLQGSHAQKAPKHKVEQTGSRTNR